MRHGIAGNTLNRQTAHRKATIRDMAKATLLQERILTTVAKAKEARKMVDKLITLGKSGTLANKRRAYQILCDHKLVSSLFNTTAPRFKDRPGGYTRIIRYTNRRGDNAQLAFLELTEKAPIEVAAAPVEEKKTKKKKAGKSDAAKEAAVEDAQVVEEAPDTEKAPKKTEKKTPAKDDKAPKVEKKQDKGNKNILGGVKKMFNRRQSGS